jgi:GT2 family glycosyltransferase
MVRPLDESGRVGATVAKIYLAGSERVIDSAGADFNNLGFCWGRGTNQRDQGQYDSGGEVPAATACGMVVRRRALGDELLFDPMLFMYYEEFDLSLRIRGRGYAIVYVPAAIVYHRRSATVQRVARQPLLFRQFYGNRNRLKILAKYYPPLLLVRNLPLICLSLLYWHWMFLRREGVVFLLRALAAQARFALDGLRERARADGVDPRLWLPWMTQHRLRDLWTLKVVLGAHVSDR